MPGIYKLTGFDNWLDTVLVFQDGLTDFQKHRFKWTIKEIMKEYERVTYPGIFTKLKELHVVKYPYPELVNNHAIGICFPDHISVYFNDEEELDSMIDSHELAHFVTLEYFPDDPTFWNNGPHYFCNAGVFPYLLQRQERYYGTFLEYLTTRKSYPVTLETVNVKLMIDMKDVIETKIKDGTAPKGPNAYR